MARILYLVHRFPYPPNKGDKVRSYHLLKHLVAAHEVYLGTFIDDPEDEIHAPILSAMCKELHTEKLHPLRSRIASLAGLVTGEALTLRYYRSASMRAWVSEVMEREAIDVCVVFSSSMAQYVDPHPGMPLLLDMVDVDSAKWAEYAPRHRWPLSYLYKREGQKLLDFERKASARSQVTYLATPKEAELYCQLAPECIGRVESLSNGVDTDYFQPEASRATPFAGGDIPLVFTGAMDYWPNIDAVCWFANHVLPLLRQVEPRMKFFIVGRSPSGDVLELASDPTRGIAVTGTVEDVRPYLQHAAVVVAPLRLARGIQNKILEAMAMQRPVVAARACIGAMTAEPGRHLLGADTAEEYRDAILGLLAHPERALELGRAAWAHVLESYGWAANLGAVDRSIEQLNRSQPLPVMSSELECSA